MENKMKKWEMQYESYINGEKKQRLEELKGKLGKNKGMTKEEYEEYKKMLKIQENLPKVENLLECQRNLIKAKTILIQELRKREDIENEQKNEQKNYNKEQKIIEEELAKIIDKKEKIAIQLKDKNLSKEEKDRLKDQFAKCENEIQTNNEKYLKSVEKKPLEKKTDDSVFANFSKKQLKDKVLKISIKMDVCNFYITRLMKGKDIENIKEEEKSIDWTRDKNYKKKIENEIKTFKLPKDQKGKMENLKEVAKENIKEKQEKVNKTEYNPEKENIETSLIEVSEFDQKHPRLAAIKNWFKQKFDRKSKVESEKEENVEQNKKQEDASKNETKRRDKFLKDLKFMEDVDISQAAEKGIHVIRKEERVDKKKKAVQTLIENKRKAGEGKDGGTIDKLQAMLDEYEDR